jgi:hypothetical protein
MAWGKPVVDAVTEVYRAKTTYDSAREKRATNVDSHAANLIRARNAERGSTQALSDHIKEHGCWA